MSFEGRCHCGAVAYRVEAELPGEAIECNCSHCSAKGLLLAFFPAEQFTLIEGEGALTTYLFNTHKIRHQFCQTCGVQPFADGTGPGGAAMRAVNLRSVPGLDLTTLARQPIDGASM